LYFPHWVPRRGVTELGTILSLNRSNKPPQPKPGNEREISRQLATPNIERIYGDQWAAQTPPFDEFTAMRVEVTGYEGEEESEVYVFKINMDNTPLLNEIKQRRLCGSVGSNDPA
jgi:hypothetical protein